MSTESQTRNSLTFPGFPDQNVIKFFPDNRERILGSKRNDNTDFGILHRRASSFEAN